MLTSSSAVSRPALTSSVELTVSDGVDDEEGVTESEGIGKHTVNYYLY